MHKWLRILVLALLVLPATAPAESTPKAQKWLIKLAEIYDKGPLMVDFELEMGSAPVPGAPPGGKIKGQLTQKDRTHQRIEIAMDMGGMQVNMKTVNDGTLIWTEMDMGGNKRVIKLTQEAAEKAAQNQGLAPGMSGNLDPISQIEKISEVVDFEFAGTENGQVTLHGKLNEESRKEAFGGGPMPGLDAITIVIDEKTAFPSRIVMGGEQPILTMSFNNLRFVKASELPAGTFEYTPPEGVPVVDAAALMAGQPPGGD